MGTAWATARETAQGPLRRMIEQPPHLVEGGRPSSDVLAGQPPEAASYDDQAGRAAYDGLLRRSGWVDGEEHHKSRSSSASRSQARRNWSGEDGSDVG
jgi:hypothetical protein